MTPRLLLVDDDSRLAGMVSDYLGGAGFRLTTAGTAREGEAILKRESFDAVILDLMLPDADGLDLCRRLRSLSDVPILMLTARGEPMDRVVGLELGADDYLAKPFEPRELQARLRAILRRKGTGSSKSRSANRGRSSRMRKCIACQSPARRSSPSDPNASAAAKRSSDSPASSRRHPDSRG